MRRAGAPASAWSATKLRDLLPTDDVHSRPLVIPPLPGAPIIVRESRTAQRRIRGSLRPEAALPAGFPLGIEWRAETLSPGSKQDGLLMSTAAARPGVTPGRPAEDAGTATDMSWSTATSWSEDMGFRSSYIGPAAGSPDRQPVRGNDLWAGCWGRTAATSVTPDEPEPGPPAPNVSFRPPGPAAGRDGPGRATSRVAPDLAVEVLSPNDLDYEDGPQGGGVPPRPACGWSGS